MDSTTQLPIRGPQTSVDEYDLLIVTDATMSMRAYSDSLKPSLEAIIRVSATTGCFSNIGVLAYRDYDCPRETVEWSGWYGPNGTSVLSRSSHSRLISWVERLHLTGGDSWDEAAKSGLAEAYRVMREGDRVKTIVLLYADAPPHMLPFEGYEHVSGKKERKALGKSENYGGHGHLFQDWVSAAKTLATRAQVFPIVELTYLRWEAGAVYAYLAAITGGACVSFDRRPSAEAISKVTVNLLLSWMGVEKQGAKLSRDSLGSHVQFTDTKGIDKIVSEKDRETAEKFLPLERNGQHPRSNLNFSAMSLYSLAKVIPRCESSIMDFGKRYMTDPEYQKLVIGQLGAIIESDVSAMALNPVFGTLWRTVCNDRGNPARDELLAKFGLAVSRLVDSEKKARMTAWLEESYDRVGDILEIIKSVPENERYPCVFLDPTLRFDPKDDDANSMTFTRDDLLEIGRSCDYKILRRLGSLLTRLTYVASEDEMPGHIKNVPARKVTSIPVALAEEKHNRKFWRILLHTVLPGTMLAARPAALVAALTLRMGIKPLEAAAYSELLFARDGWNTLDIPETWNTNCLTLLLEADKKYRGTVVHDSKEETNTAHVLNPKDRALFQTLVNYKLLEMNLDTTLTAKIGWTPEKTKAPLGPVVVCKSCKFPRSVTMMGAGGICGMCHPDGCDCKDQAIHEAAVAGHVSELDNPTKEMSWVECSMSDCKAQYVVYFTEKLNVRAKCFYCRQKGRFRRDHPDYARLTTAPCVECSKCRNRMIWPEEYRPTEGFDEKNWECPACDAGSIKTVVEEEVTARKLIQSPSDNSEDGQTAPGNGTDWLIRNQNDTIPKDVLFSGRSLFHVASKVQREIFAEMVEVLPKQDTLSLKLNGKTIHNPEQLIESLRRWVGSGKVEMGTCSLCFDNKKKRDLRPACGRKGSRGCTSLICEDCLNGWYGINGVGKIINVAALSCPFCRRRTTNKIKLPEGLRYLPGLKEAIEEAGSWIYGWCNRCGVAKRHMERVCAGGAPVDYTGNFRCEDCLTGKKLRLRECPGCGVTTAKVSGCDHMTCVCGMHWCFFCGVASTAGDIYKHLSQAHGGAYQGQDYESADDYTDDLWSGDEDDLDYV
ncbi:E3 ubiquitin-protein ligase itt1 [Podospora fimiseda]|uniref:E3 ubiquitin-protein ligase itt1 n=1 Tax=Podospora fimiseda TaxID=252190 RepID=A0AAN7BSF2_9PEZI|nr:E3 ubiquitin-protein ligase itt1 [Podospora fimiseda]